MARGIRRCTPPHHEDDVIGAEHFARAIQELALRNGTREITSAVAVSSREARAQARLQRQRRGTKSEGFVMPNFRDGYKKGYKIAAVAPSQ